MAEDGAPIRVLVADDDPLVRMLLVGMIDAEPRTLLVGEADDGGRVIVLAASERPDVVLLDPALPDVDARTVIATLAESSPSPAVLLITSFESDDEVASLMAAGARDHAVRSAPREELLDRIFALVQN